MCLGFFIDIREGQIEMNTGKYHISAHCWNRLAKRNISLSEMVKAMEIGRKLHRAHATFFWVGIRETRGQRDLEHLVGVTVVTAHSEIVTVYRAKNAIAKLKRKPKKYHGARRLQQFDLAKLRAAA